MNFFTSRTQQTRNMARSELSHTDGVIQGSSIGPVMLLMYIDGLAELLEHYGIVAKLFADDINVYLIIKNDVNIISKLQIALDLMTDWANNWQFFVSVDKCSVDVTQQ